jgi:hypothetical protein
MKTPKTTQYAFVAQSLAPEPKDKRLERPSTLIVLDSGEEMAGKSSPYSAQQLEEAWDQWLSTFRLSPGNGGKPQSSPDH